MRTDEEIECRVDGISTIFGWEIEDLVVRLPFSLAKKYLTIDVTDDSWVQRGKERACIVSEMLDYMPFAWDKANNERGISASRTMSHYTSWLWLAGDDLGDIEDYEFYGKDNLVRICDLYGWDSSQWDDGRRVNN